MCTGTSELSGSRATSGKVTIATTGAGAAAGAADEDPAASVGPSEGDGGGDGGGDRGEIAAGAKYSTAEARPQHKPPNNVRAGVVAGSAGVDRVAVEFERLIESGIGGEQGGETGGKHGDGADHEA